MTECDKLQRLALYAMEQHNDALMADELTRMSVRVRRLEKALDELWADAYEQAMMEERDRAAEEARLERGMRAWHDRQMAKPFEERNFE